MSAGFRFPIFVASFLVATFAQTPDHPTFEVASVKPAPVPQGGRVYFGPPRGGPGTSDPGQITWPFAALKDILMTAYDVKAYQVIGPAWLVTERYDVAVKVPAGSTKDQVGKMWQSLLAERFGIALHHESKEFQVMELVIAKGGSKLTEVADDPDAALAGSPPKVENGKLISTGMVTMIFPEPGGGARAHAMAKAQPISRLTTMLGNQVDRPVIDKTGLTGKYDFTLDFSANLHGAQLPQPSSAGAPPSGESSEFSTDIASAVQQQLGLRLVAAKAKLDVLVIDKAEKVPTEN